MKQRKKKQAEGQQCTREKTTEILDPLPNKSTRARRKEKVKNAEPSVLVDGDIVKGEFTHVVDVCTDETVHSSQAQTASLTSVEDVKQQKSPQMVGMLRGKLLRLAPSSVRKDSQAVSQPSVPTLNVEPATESENEGEDEGGEGDKEHNSEVKAGADSHRDVEEEVLLPDIAGGNCTPVRASQNSK